MNVHVTHEQLYELVDPRGSQWAGVKMRIRRVLSEDAGFVVCQPVDPPSAKELTFRLVDLQPVRPQPVQPEARPTLNSPWVTLGVLAVDYVVYRFAGKRGLALYVLGVCVGGCATLVNAHYRGALDINKLAVRNTR